MSIEFKLNYLENKLRKSENKLPDSEITLIANLLLQQCNKMGKSIHDLEIIQLELQQLQLVDKEGLV